MTALNTSCAVRLATPFMVVLMETMRAESYPDDPEPEDIEEDA